MKAFKTILVCVPAVVFCSITLLNAGCKSQPALERHTTDTVRVEKVVTYRDTVLKTEPVEVTTTLTIPCPDAVVKPQTKQLKNAKLTVNQTGSVLTIDCLCDTAAIKAKLQSVKENQYRASTDNKSQTVVVEKKYVPGFVAFLAYSGAAMWLILVLYLIIKTFLKKQS